MDIAPNKQTLLRASMPTLVLILVTVLSLYLCFRLAAPFIAALTFAIALAVLFMPLQKWLEAKLKRASLAALVTTVAIAAIVVIPLTFVGEKLLVQAATSAAQIEAKVTSGEWRRNLQAEPELVKIVDVVEERIDLPGILKALNSWLSTTAGLIVKGSVMQLIGICLTFYLLFFFLRDRVAALNALREILPLSTVEMDHLFARIGDTIYAIVYGTLAVAAVQGFLGGLMFWWLDLQLPLLWGVVMALLAVVPVLGAFVVWLPAAIYLGLEGNWGNALILIAWGMFVVGTIDNLMRPVLVGNRLKLHTVLAFMSVVGGLILFGAAGLILGPLILTITIEMLQVWRNRGTALNVSCT
jgi:predicted PurR-regulated permease PerM